jgi:hypothetical protein
MMVSIKAVCPPLAFNVGSSSLYGVEDAALQIHLDIVNNLLQRLEAACCPCLDKLLFG